jgi:hypothetical protein
VRNKYLVEEKTHKRRTNSLIGELPPVQMLPTSRRGFDNPCSSLLAVTMIGRKVVVEKKGVPTRSRAREEKPRGKTSPRKHTKLTHCNQQPMGKTRREEDEEVKPSASSNPRRHHQDPYTKSLAPGSLPITQPIFWSRVQFGCCHEIFASRVQFGCYYEIFASRARNRLQPRKLCFVSICYCFLVFLHKFVVVEIIAVFITCFLSFNGFFIYTKSSDLKATSRLSTNHNVQSHFLQSKGVSSKGLHHHIKYTTIRFCIPGKHSRNIKPCTEPISPPISSLPISLHRHYTFKQHFFGILIHGPSI